MRLIWIGLLLVGCGGGDPLADDGNIPQWANSSSALGAFEVAREPVAFFDDAGDYPDPACPIRSKDDTAATISRAAPVARVASGW